MRSIVHVIGPGDAGVAESVRWLVRGQVKRGLAVHVICPPQTQQRHGFEAAGARVSPLVVTAVSAMVALRRALREEPIDVIHAHGPTAGLAASIARPAGTALVVDWHGPLPEQGVLGHAVRQQVRAVAAVAQLLIADSTELVTAATGLGAADVRPAPVAAPALPLPVRDTTELREEMGVPLDAPLILGVGRLEEASRYDVLITAAARWRDRQPQPYVVLAGAGPAYRTLAAQAVMARAAVAFVGERDDVAELLRAADIAVVTGTPHARSPFVLQAAVAGRALVATAEGALPELLGGAAVLVPPGEERMVDAAIRGLLDDPAARAVAAAALAELARTWLTEDEVADKITDWCAEVAAARDAPHGPR